MISGKKTLGLALAGLAAFAWYKYSKMTEEQKRDLANNIKSKGRKFVDSLGANKKYNLKPTAYEETLHM